MQTLRQGLYTADVDVNLNLKNDANARKEESMLQLIKNVHTEELLKEPLAFCLLTHIALRTTAKTSFSVEKLEKGEVLMAHDEQAMGMTYSQYRANIEKLVEWKLIKARGTNRGTAVKLNHCKIYNPYLKARRPATKKQIDDIKIIIEYLNEKGGYGYKVDSAHVMKHVVARLNEGFTIDDFKMVVDIKVKEWKGTKWEKFLRPETLFGTKFEGYLNQAPTPKQKQADGCVVCGEIKSVMRVINGKKHCIDCADML